MSDYDDAREVALRFLDYQPRTRWEVETRLRRAGWDEAVVQEVVEALVALQAIDDARFAAQWVAERATTKGHGRARLESDLRRRGISRSDAAAAVAGLDIDDERAAAARLARERLARCDPADRDARRRVAAYLARRGYTWEIVDEAIRAATGDDD